MCRPPILRRMSLNTSNIDNADKKKFKDMITYNRQFYVLTTKPKKKQQPKNKKKQKKKKTTKKKTKKKQYKVGRLSEYCSLDIRVWVGVTDTHFM